MKRKQFEVLAHSPGEDWQEVPDTLAVNVNELYNGGFSHHESFTIGNNGCSFAVFVRKTEEAGLRQSPPQEIAANPQSETDLRGMLKQIANHSYEPAMGDAQFRRFARENAQYALGQQKNQINLQPQFIGNL